MPSKSYLEGAARRADAEADGAEVQVRRHGARLEAPGRERMKNPGVGIGGRAGLLEQTLEGSFWAVSKPKTSQDVFCLIDN